MGFIENTKKYLGIVSKKDFEQLQETVATQNLLLQNVDVQKSKTGPSSIARESKSVEDSSGLMKRRVSVKELQLLYLNNQFVFRGVNVRADELITRGYKILNGDETGRKACEELIKNSGGNNLFWQLSVNSVTKDTPIIVKFPDDSIDIIEISELYKDENDTTNIGRYSTQEIRDLQVMTDEGWKNIKHVFRHKIDEDIYKIRTGTGLAKVTHDHSLMSDGKETHSKYFNIGSKIDVIDVGNCETQLDYGTITKDLAWLIGFFVADGTAGVYKNSKQWKITNTNKDFLEKAELIIKENYDKTAKIHWFGNIGDIRFSPQKNEKIFNWYLKNCYTPNRFKKVPKLILNSFKEIKTAFMEGYWAGDGDKDVSWEHSRYATDSFSLLAGIEFIVKSLGKSISLNTVNCRDDVYLISIRDGLEDKNFLSNIEKINEVFKSEYENKKALSDEEISELTDIPRRTVCFYRSLNEIPSKFKRQIEYDENDELFILNEKNHLSYLTKFKKDGIIEQIKTQKYNDYVYDIATENHKFIAGVGGLLHHNTDVAGDGYLEKVLNEAGTKIAYLRHVNPINFGFWTEPEDKDTIVLDSKGKPEAYMQIVTSKDSAAEERVKVAKERIMHLRFNTFGDEFNGISSIQPVYNTAVRLMNMEQAAAEAAVKTANPTWAVYTESKSIQDLNLWASLLNNISSKEVVFFPKNVTAEIKSPGNQNFNDYSDYFLDAVVAALGVPKAILTGASDSSGGNRATVQSLSKHFLSVIRANQRYVEELFNGMFAEYGEMAGFKPPQLVFNDIAEDADRNGQRAKELYEAGLMTLEEARILIGLEYNDNVAKELVPLRDKNLSSGKIDPNKEEKKQDMEVWHGAEPGSPEGSQKGNKAKQKIDKNVPSVR